MSDLSESRQHNPSSNWSSGLQCDWVAWRVVDSGILRLDMPDFECCDMSGAIKTAKALCPTVRRIDTYSGGKLDTMYVMESDKWTSQ